MKKGRCVFIIGFMASGKSTVGRHLASRLGLPFADTDDVIEERTGMKVRELFALRGEARFRELEMEILSELKDAGGSGMPGGLGRFDRLLSGLAGGGGAVISTGGGLPCTSGAMRLMKETGAVVYLRAGVDDILERLALVRDEEARPVFMDLKERALDKRRQAPGSNRRSERDALREEIAALLAAREVCYLEADLVVENGNAQSREETVKRIVEALEE